jgi:2-keto-4-pentenoate hydratase/2-oxohepta-3-ene-1,7-dioic acid hydratase in catechol pathway
MRLARLGEMGKEIPVVLTPEGDALDLRPITHTIDGEFLAGGGIAAVANAVAAGALPPLEGHAEMRIGSPIARPGSVVCVGMNYAAHAAESGSPPPVRPVMFLKPANTVIGPNDDVELPDEAVKADWEVELGVVFGRRTYRISSPGESAAAIAGFVAADDLSERDFQLRQSGGQWSKGKALPGFAPLGPWLVTPDEIDHRSVNLRSFVNGEPRQASNSSDMVFSIDYLIWNLSQFMAFEAGDVLLTGTPQGVALSGRFPYLCVGDVVEIEIDGLGRQRHQMIAG